MRTVGSGKLLLCIMEFFVSPNNKLRETISIYDVRTMARLSAELAIDLGFG
jgi:hypothetical protein